MFKITVYIKSFSQNDNKEIDTEVKHKLIHNVKTTKMRKYSLLQLHLHVADPMTQQR